MSSRSKNPKNGFSFFLLSLFTLSIAVLYVFLGDLIFTPTAIIPADGEVIVSFIDVGQGDAILIRTAENAVLIDAGEHSNVRAVVDELRAAEITRLCYVVATHPHSDHIGGLPLILRDFEVGQLVMPDIEHNTATFENLLEAIESHDIDVYFPEPNDILRAGSIYMQVLSPPTEHFNDVNNNSVVLRLVHGETAFLFMGDAEEQAERWILENTRAVSANVLALENTRAVSANVLKTGHHGSRTSTSDEFLAAVSPDIAIISVGRGNRYEHPHEETLGKLDERGVAVFRTDIDGTVRLVSDGRGIYSCLS